MKPPKFDGKTPLDEFVIAFENCARFNQWSRYDKAAYLRNSLTGSASQLLRDSASDTYSELIGKLERRYGTKGQQERFRAEIRCRRRKKDESVTELAEDIRGLMALAYPGDQTASANVAVARDAFLAALDGPELEEKVRSREPEDLDVGCRIALRQEVIRNAIYAETSGYKGHQARQAVEEVESGPEETDDRGDHQEVCDWEKEEAKSPTEVRSAKVVEAAGCDHTGQNELLKNLLNLILEEKKLRLEAESKVQRLEKELEQRNCIDAARQLVPSSLIPAASQSEPSSSPAQGQFKRNKYKGPCFNCGQDGHWRKYCPRPPRQKRDPNSQQTVQKYIQGADEDPAERYEVRSNRAVDPGRDEVTSGYLEVEIEGRPVQCLVDTGSATSVFPSEVIQPDWMRETHRKMRAANGTMISVEGEADIPISLPGFKSMVKAVISDHVAEPMLGYDWMTDVGALVDCRNQRLIVNQHEYELQSGPTDDWSRNMVLVKQSDGDEGLGSSGQAETTRGSARNPDEVPVSRVGPARARVWPGMFVRSRK